MACGGGFIRLCWLLKSQIPSQPVDPYALSGVPSVNPRGTHGAATKGLIVGVAGRARRTLLRGSVSAHSEGLASLSNGMDISEPG